MQIHRPTAVFMPLIYYIEEYNNETNETWNAINLIVKMSPKSIPVACPLLNCRQCVNREDVRLLSYSICRFVWIVYYLFFYLLFKPYNINFLIMFMFNYYLHIIKFKKCCNINIQMCFRIQDHCISLWLPSFLPFVSLKQASLTSSITLSGKNKRRALSCY